MSAKTTRFLLTFFLVLARSLPCLGGDLGIEEVGCSLSRKDYSTTTLDGLVFLAGGRMNGVAVDTVDVYEADKEKWSSASLSEPRYLPAMVTLGKHVFIAGGHLAEGRYSNTVDVYDTEKREWSRFTLSQARSHITAYATNDKVLFAGGRIGSTNSNVVDIYDVGKGTLERAQLSQARYYPTVARVTDGAILFAGGYLADGRFSDVLDIYAPDTKQWQSARLSQARDELSVTSIGDTVVITGRNRDERHTRTVIDIFEISVATRASQPTSDQDTLGTDEAFLSSIEEEMIGRIMNEAPILAIKKRIDAQIETLNGESLEDSVDRLDEVEAYYWPGAVRNGAFVPVLPLDPATGQWDVHTIMSNRRFLKVYQEISDIGENRAEALVGGELKASLAQYQSLLAEYMLKNKRYFDSLEPGKVPSTGPLLQIGNNRDGTPTLAGTRLKVLSLALLAGNLRLDGAKDSMRTVAAYALEQKAHLHADPFNSEIVAADFLANIGLCNRQILVTGILGTSMTSEEEDRLLEDMRCQKQERVLTGFDARATPYDLYSRTQGGPIPVDYSKGRITARYVKPIDDSTFERLLKHVNVRIE